MRRSSSRERKKERKKERETRERERGGVSLEGEDFVCLLHLYLTCGVISSRGGIVNEDKQKKIKTSSLIYA